MTTGWVSSHAKSRGAILLACALPAAILGRAIPNPAWTTLAIVLGGVGVFLVAIDYSSNLYSIVTRPLDRLLESDSRLKAVPITINGEALESDDPRQRTGIYTALMMENATEQERRLPGVPESIPRLKEEKITKDEAKELLALFN